jgi:alginate O-acetyltransferase complex protein AlgI
MVFSSLTFLFAFLPAVLLLNLLTPARFRNTTLLLASLFFYAWGETVFVLLMLASIGVNYLAGLALGGARRTLVRRGVLLLALVANLGFLAWFKYAGFLAENANALGSLLGTGILEMSPVHLPIGISFFTFQALSYVIDVYRGKTEAQRNPVKVALFISLFPQLIAGPIVRYRDIAAQIERRILEAEGFAEGVRRFCVGLAKKVLIANTLAVPADQIFALPPHELSASVAWFGAVCYALQIYFDFSGYSDMAIGLGRMFGFRIPENFNYPYIATSITEFWRRWHISLSSWFRDYLYVPLGGNRRGPWRTYRNLIVVFLLCGLWHGASWNFVIWGLFHGGFLILERLGLGRALRSASAPLAHGYCLLAVTVGWVFFRAETLTHAAGYLSAMLGQSTAAGAARYIVDYADGETLIAFLVGLIASTPWLADASRRLRFDLATTASTAAIAVVLIVCAVKLANQTYNPFIYFRF